jgi:hypothetical protein
MGWEAVGALGGILGAYAVVITLVFLAIQVRQYTQTMRETNRLERASAIDRHTDSINRFRITLANNRELAEIYLKGHLNTPLDELETLRLNNAWITLVNTQRANYERARLVDEEGLATQASRSIAAEMVGSKIFQELWGRYVPWHSLVSKEFVNAVDAEYEYLVSQTTEYKSPTGIDNVTVSDS